MDANSQKIIGDYIAGASVVFGIIIILLEAFAAYCSWTGLDLEANKGFVFVYFVVLHIIGASLGSYLISNKRRTGSIKAGITTSMIAYIFEYFYNLIFVGSFENSVPSAVALIIGGILGALYANYRRVKKLVTLKPP